MTSNSKRSLYDTTITCNSKLPNHVDETTFGIVQTLLISGLNEYKFQSYINPSIGSIDVLNIDITKVQDNPEIVNTIFLNEAMFNDGIHTHDYIRVLPTSCLTLIK